MTPQEIWMRNRISLIEQKRVEILRQIEDLLGESRKSQQLKRDITDELRSVSRYYRRRLASEPDQTTRKIMFKDGPMAGRYTEIAAGTRMFQAYEDRDYDSLLPKPISPEKIEHRTVSYEFHSCHIPTRMDLHDELWSLVE